MARIARAAFLRANAALYAGLARPVIFRSSAQTAHERLLRWLRWADERSWLVALMGGAHRLAFAPDPVEVGGVTLPAPLILAAGVVKGDGFESEQDAQDALAAGRNIIPGWRALPRLAGPIELGSFTRWPRLGNPGTVVWRDVPNRSTQNRVGLRNPGAQAAASFLAARRRRLPPQFGINIAISPGVDDPDQQTGEALDSFRLFADHEVYPAWFTLNLSCPNTEDDPNGNQSADLARQVCGAAADYLRGVSEMAGRAIPLWVKIGPTLSVEQLQALMAALEEVGARAVVATNTLPMPSPDDPGVMAGVGGRRLREKAVETAAILMREKTARGYAVDVIGCGGVEDRASYRAFAALGVRAVQYWSALVYRGPLAAALIAHEAGR
jgi:dihydroorotate dehydrogenase